MLKSTEVPDYHGLKMEPYCDVLRCIMIQCVYQYCKLTIYASIYHCVSINKMFSVMDKKFLNDTFVEENPCAIW